MKHRYALVNVLRDTAHRIKAEAFARKQAPDVSPTTIRTIINDIHDDWQKHGWTVNDNYNQERAVKRVRALVADL